jgi:hypothetical protein
MILMMSTLFALAAAIEARVAVRVDVMVGIIVLVGLVRRFADSLGSSTLYLIGRIGEPRGARIAAAFLFGVTGIVTHF